MKNNAKRLFCLLLCAIMLSGCCLRHNWGEATCEHPSTCWDCGKTQGDKADHQWEDATCQHPKTCEECGKERGELADHSWKDATCEEPQTCKECGITQGEALGHQWEGTTCLTCGATRELPAEPVADGFFTFTPEEFMERYDAIGAQISTPVYLGAKRFATSSLISYYIDCQGEHVLKLSIYPDEATGKIKRIDLEPTGQGAAGGSLVSETQNAIAWAPRAICPALTKDEWNELVKTPQTSYSRNGKTYDTFVCYGVKFSFTLDDATGVFSLRCTPDK